jgi:hypothetical protein
MFRLESENKTGPAIEAGFLLLFAQSFRSPATADLQGCNECREMTGSFPVHAVVIAPLTYFIVSLVLTSKLCRVFMARE